MSDMLRKLLHHEKKTKSPDKADNQGTQQDSHLIDPSGSENDIAQTEINGNFLTPTEGISQEQHIQQKIFIEDVTPKVAVYDLPGSTESITSTSQLAYCLSLLNPSSLSNDVLDETQHAWSQDIVNDPDQKEKCQTMATDIVRAFVRDELKKPNAVVEVVSLTAVLDQQDSRKLLQAFVDGIDHSVLLNTHLLDGLAVLIRNAVQGYIQADDLIKILELLNTRLTDTHKQSTQHIYQISLTMSSVLDSMVDSQVEGLSREQLHEPLSSYLKDFKESSDPYLVYQAAYAYQALQYVPDDETILQTMIRRTGKVIQGISGVVSAVKALDLNGFISGLESIQESLSGAEAAIGLIKDTYENVKALAESGNDLMESLQDSLSFTRKSAWYPALRGLDRLILEGRFTEFETLVRDAPCKRNLAFQWGVCQRLGEISINDIWDDNIRKSSITFLEEIYANDATWGQDPTIKQFVLNILRQLGDSNKATIAKEAQTLLQRLKTNGSAAKKQLYQGFEKDAIMHPITVSHPPREFPLLEEIQNKPDVESPLQQLKRNRLQDQGRDIYISPRAKTSPKATEDFDLTSKVQEFLEGDKKVFLLLGDSGSGKSTFNRALETSLWQNYDKDNNNRIPLFVYLPAIEKPEHNMIDKQLSHYGFDEAQINELRATREFIVICDGYDESQQTQNLYVSNLLNHPGGWRAQMVISCRTEYNGVDYKYFFEPTNRSGGEKNKLFQEAIFSPFSKDQIQDYVAQYVSLTKSSWDLDNYMQAIRQIPNLQDMVKNPFLLKLAMEVLPRMMKKDSKFSSVHITRVRLYDEFLAQWIERNKIRLGEMDLSEHSKDAFKKLSNMGFQRNGMMYFIDFATSIYDNQNGNPLVIYSEIRDRGTWKESLLNDEDGKDILREAIPLARNADQYRFIHKSVLEYGLSLAVIDPSSDEDEENTVPRSSTSRRGSTSSDLSFEELASTEPRKTDTSQSLLDSPLGRRDLTKEPSILQFLTERVQQQPAFKDQLLAVVEKSKTDKAARVGAANAITILVQAGVQFNGADLRGIKVPRADLSFGMFDSARLEGADLRKANLRGIWLRQANLDGVQMDGAQFGELPFLQPNDFVLSCACSPDGSKYAVGLQGGNIDIYSASSWDKIQTLKGHTGSVKCLSFSLTSTRLASGGNDNKVRVWDVDEGICILTLEGHSDWVDGVGYSPKGDRIVSGSQDKSVRLWDAETGNCIHTLEGHAETVTSVAYSPKGDQVASGSSDKTARLWDVDTGSCIRILEGHGNWVTSLAYSPKGDQIATASFDSTIRLWDVGTGDYIRTLKGHSFIVSSVVYSPKGDQVVSGGNDSTVRLWDVDTGDCIQTLQGHSVSVTGVAFTPKGDRIVSGSFDQTVRLWDVDASDYDHTLQGHTNIVTSTAYSPKGDQIASGSHDLTVRLWNAETGDCVQTLQGHSEVVTTVAYSPKGDRIASGSRDKTVRLWDVATGECVHVLEGHTGDLNVLVYSPKGDRIASGGNDMTLRLWDADTGDCVQTLEGHRGNITGVAYSPKGDRIVSGSNDMTVRLWNIDTGDCIHTLQGHYEWISCVAYSPKGDQIASGSNDKTVLLWDVDTGKYLQTIQDHTNMVTSVAYSPKGDYIASGSYDNTVRLWDVELGQSVLAIPATNKLVLDIAWANTPDSLELVTGSDDKSVRRWKISKDGGEHRSYLCWSSSNGALRVDDASFRNVQGLSEVNAKLISQRKAFVESAV
ncbi:hypothetical protein BGZ46_010142 [Entomortierella lignicola]|nr:hypothetical protein BGZ46_010142 [Entomortierella lignicola]